MPLNPSVPIPKAVYNLADETAGGQIRFRAKLKILKIQVFMSPKPLHFDGIKGAHLADTARVAFDVYASENGGDYKFINIPTGFDKTDLYYEYTYLNTEEALDIDVLLNFPLYGAVDEAEISAPQKQFEDDRKIIIYGGSIEQRGMCFASRYGEGKHSFKMA